MTHVVVGDIGWTPGLLVNPSTLPGSGTGDDSDDSPWTEHPDIWLLPSPPPGPQTHEVTRRLPGLLVTPKHPPRTRDIFCNSSEMASAPRYLVTPWHALRTQDKCGDSETFYGPDSGDKILNTVKQTKLQQRLSLLKLHKIWNLMTHQQNST